MFSRVGKNFKDYCQILGKQTEENKNKGKLESFLSLSVFYRKSVVAECESFAEMVNNNNKKSLLGFFPQFSEDGDHTIFVPVQLIADYLALKVGLKMYFKPKFPCLR